MWRVVGGWGRQWEVGEGSGRLGMEVRVGEGSEKWGVVWE